MKTLSAPWILLASTLAFAGCLAAPDEYDRYRSDPDWKEIDLGGDDYITEVNFCLAVRPNLFQKPVLPVAGFYAKEAYFETYSDSGDRGNPLAKVRERFQLEYPYEVAGELLGYMDCRLVNVAELSPDGNGIAVADFERRVHDMGAIVAFLGEPERKMAGPVGSLIFDKRKATLQLEARAWENSQFWPGADADQK